MHKTQNSSNSYVGLRSNKANLQIHSPSYPQQGKNSSSKSVASSNNLKQKQLFERNEGQEIDRLDVQQISISGRQHHHQNEMQFLKSHVDNKENQNHQNIELEAYMKNLQSNKFKISHYEGQQQETFRQKSISSSPFKLEADMINYSKANVVEKKTQKEKTGQRNREEEYFTAQNNQYENLEFFQEPQILKDSTNLKQSAGTKNSNKNGLLHMQQQQNQTPQQKGLYQQILNSCGVKQLPQMQNSTAKSSKSHSSKGEKDNNRSLNKSSDSSSSINYSHQEYWNNKDSNEQQFSQVETSNINISSLLNFNGQFGSIIPESYLEKEQISRQRAFSQMEQRTNTNNHKNKCNTSYQIIEDYSNSSVEQQNQYQKLIGNKCNQNNTYHPKQNFNLERPDNLLLRRCVNQQKVGQDVRQDSLEDKSENNLSSNLLQRKVDLIANTNKQQQQYHQQQQQQQQNGYLNKSVNSSYSQNQLQKNENQEQDQSQSKSDFIKHSKAKYLSQSEINGRKSKSPQPTSIEYQNNEGKGELENVLLINKQNEISILKKDIRQSNSELMSSKSKIKSLESEIKNLKGVIEQDKKQKIINEDFIQKIKGLQFVLSQEKKSANKVLQEIQLRNEKVILILSNLSNVILLILQKIQRQKSPAEKILKQIEDNLEPILMCLNPVIADMKQYSCKLFKQSNLEVPKETDQIVNLVAPSKNKPHSKIETNQRSQRSKKLPNEEPQSLSQSSNCISKQRNKSNAVIKTKQFASIDVEEPRSEDEEVKTRNKNNLKTSQSSCVLAQSLYQQNPNTITFSQDTNNAGTLFSQRSLGFDDNNGFNVNKQYEILAHEQQSQMQLDNCNITGEFSAYNSNTSSSQQNEKSIDNYFRNNTFSQLQFNKNTDQGCIEEENSEEGEQNMMEGTGKVLSDTLKGLSDTLRNLTSEQCDELFSKDNTQCNTSYNVVNNSRENKGVAINTYQNQQHSNLQSNNGSGYLKSGKNSNEEDKQIQQSQLLLINPSKISLKEAISNSKSEADIHSKKQVSQRKERSTSIIKQNEHSQSSLELVNSNIQLITEDNQLSLSHSVQQEEFNHHNISTFRTNEEELSLSEQQQQQQALSGGVHEKRQIQSEIESLKQKIQQRQNKRKLQSSLNQSSISLSTSVSAISSRDRDLSVPSKF